MKKASLRECAALSEVLSGMLGRLPVPPLPSCRSRLGPPLPNSAFEGCTPRMYQVTRALPKPPRRKDVSVPGIRKDRGKLPAPTAAPGGAGAVEPGWSCDSWSRRCWRRSWLARKSDNSSARAADGPIANGAASAQTTATVIAAFRPFFMVPPVHVYPVLVEPFRDPTAPEPIFWLGPRRHSSGSRQPVLVLLKSLTSMRIGHPGVRSSI